MTKNHHNRTKITSKRPQTTTDDQKQPTNDQKTTSKRPQTSLSSQIEKKAELDKSE